MRRRLTLLVVATTSLVLVAFLVPLGYLVRQVAEDRAVNAATHEAEALAPVVATVDRDVLRLTLQQVADRTPQDYPLTVFLPDGTVLGASAARTEAVRLAQQGRSLVVDTGSGRAVLVAVHGRGQGTTVVRAYVSDRELHQGVWQSWAVLAGLGLVLLGLSVLLADRMARSLIRPLVALAAVADRVSGGDLDARVSPAGTSELRAVGRALNHLADRIEELLDAERQSVADLSHRLRTPLTAMRLDAEGLSDPEEADRMTAEVDQVQRGVDEVIDEARRPVREGVAARCDVAGVVRERLGFWSALAEEEEREVTTDLAAGPVPVRASDTDVAAAVDALLGNVFGHTERGTGFAVQLHPQPAGGALLVLTDQGPGFGDGDPFARGASADEGTGLGLDIVRRTATASGGSATVGPGPGASVRVVLGGPPSSP